MASAATTIPRVMHNRRASLSISLMSHSESPSTTPVTSPRSLPLSSSLPVNSLNALVSPPSSPRSSSFLMGLSPSTSPGTAAAHQHSSNHISAASITNAVKAGWMIKQGHLFKNWRRRWFVLKDKILYYFSSPTALKPKGIISLCNYMIKLVDDPKVLKQVNKTDFVMFHLTGVTSEPKKEFLLVAESEQDMEEWICSILFEMYKDYMHEAAPDRASMTQVAQQEPSTVNALMEKGQHNLDERDDLGKTPLFVAVQLNQASIIKSLLSRGADVNKATDEGITPLHEAMALGNLAVVRLLISHGAYIEACAASTGQTPIFLAIQKGNYDVIEDVLSTVTEDQKESILDAQDCEGKTPLHQAICHNTDKRIIELLLQHGALLNAHMNNDNAFSEEMRSNAHPLGVIESKYDPPTNYTPLQLASRLGRLEIVKLLLEQMPSNDDIKGAFKVAIWAQHIDIADLLATKITPAPELRTSQLSFMLSKNYISTALALSDNALLEHNFVEADMLLRIIWKVAEEGGNPGIQVCTLCRIAKLSNLRSKHPKTANPKLIDSEARRYSWRQAEEAARCYACAIAIFETNISFPDSSSLVKTILKGFGYLIKKLLQQVIGDCIEALSKPPFQFSFIMVQTCAAEDKDLCSSYDYIVLVEKDSEEALEYFQHFRRLLKIKLDDIGMKKWGVMRELAFNAEKAQTSSYYDEKSVNNLGSRIAFNCVYSPEQLVEVQRYRWSDEKIFASDILKNVMLIAGAEDPLQHYEQLVYRAMQDQKDVSEISVNNSLSLKAASVLSKYQSNLSTSMVKSSSVGASSVVYNGSTTNTQHSAAYASMSSFEMDDETESFKQRTAMAMMNRMKESEDEPQFQSFESKSFEEPKLPAAAAAPATEPIETQEQYSSDKLTLAQQQFLRQSLAIQIQALYLSIRNGHPTALHELAKLPNHDDVYRTFISCLDCLFVKNLNHRDEFGCTPLHYSARAKNQQLYVCLHSLGADPTIKDCTGKTPFNLMEEALGYELDEQYAVPVKLPPA